MERRREEAKWHQDIQFWPHTNYEVITLGVYLDDVTDDMSPMGVIPNSHNGPLYNLYDDNGEWTGALNDSDIDNLDLESAVYLGGLAGSITVHNCRCVHGSAPNRAAKPRPLLLCTTPPPPFPSRTSPPMVSTLRSLSEANALSGQSLTPDRC